MKNGVFQEKVLGHILFLVYAIELQYVIESLKVFYNCCADDIQINFSFKALLRPKKYSL